MDQNRLRSMRSFVFGLLIFLLPFRAGHAVQQEYKASVLDLLDALACPTDEYLGVDSSTNLAWKDSIPVAEDDSSTLATLAESKSPPKVGVLFKLAAPKTYPSEKETKNGEPEVAIRSPDPAPTTRVTPAPINIVATIASPFQESQLDSKKEEKESILVPKDTATTPLRKDRESATPKQVEVPKKLALQGDQSDLAEEEKTEFGIPKEIQVPVKTPKKPRSPLVSRQSTQNPRSKSVV